MHFSILIFNIFFNVPMWTVCLCTLPRWHGTKWFKYLPVALGWTAFVVADRSTYAIVSYARERLVYWSPLYSTIRRRVRGRP